MAGKKPAAEAAVDAVGAALEDFEGAVKHAVSEIESKVEAVVSKWRAEHLTNNPFSRDTAAWNVLHEKLPHLVRAIVEEIG